MQPRDLDLDQPSETSPPSEEVFQQIQRLKDPDWSVRQAATEELGRIGDMRAVEPLYIALKDANSSVRAAAALALEQLEAARAFELLCRTLKDPDWVMRRAATTELGRIGGTRVVEPLCTALKDRDWSVRISAANMLKQVGDTRAVEPLCAALTDEHKQVRASAATALGHLRDVRAVEALCAARKDPEDSVRVEVAAALGRIGDMVTLPLRILAASNLTPVQQLKTLEALTGVSSRIAGKMVRYKVGNVQTFCENLCRHAGTEESVKQAAEAVLAELRKRMEARVLLRAGTRNELRESEELLRGITNASNTPAPDELLRPAETSAKQAQPAKPGILSRLFKRK